MDNFFVHKLEQKRETYIIHFKDILYWSLKDLDNGTLYVAHTAAEGPNIALMNDEGLETYNKWMNYKNK